MVEKIFEADKNELDNVLAFSEEQLENAGCNAKEIMPITVAVEEIFVNIANYAYREKGGKVSFSIDYEKEKNEIIFIFSDSGIPFDPTAKPDPDITLSAEERQIGGLGIFMCKMIMDKVSYQRNDNKNILTMSKILK